MMLVTGRSGHLNAKMAFEGLEPCEVKISRRVLRGVRREAHKVWWLEIATPAKFSQQPGTEFCAVGGLSIQDGNKHCEA